jgi:hypothetical protein
MILKTVDDDISPHLRQYNSIYRFNLRRIEKNRFPLKRGCAVCGGSFLCRNIEQFVERQYYLGPDKRGNARHVCSECGFENKVKSAAETLYHLINAIPVAERDREEVYPDDFRYPRVPLWRAEKMRWPGLALRDYAEPARLLTKFGSEFAYRQKAASPVRVIEGGDYNIRKTLEAQLALQRIGRLYKNSCWWSKKEKPRLFDKAEASSWKKAQLWKPGEVSIKFDPADSLKLEKQERAEMFRTARSGGSVQHPEGSAKRHARLASSQAAYNEQSASCWLVRPRPDGAVGLNELYRKNRSLNIPVETIEARNAMIANLECDFAPHDETRAA